MTTFSPYLSQPHHIRDLTSSDIALPTRALPTHSNWDNQHDTKVDSAIESQPSIVIAIAVAAGFMGILLILLLTLYRLYKTGHLARSRSHALEVVSSLSEWSLNINTSRRNDMRIDPFNSGTYLCLGLVRTANLTTMSSVWDPHHTL